MDVMCRAWLTANESRGWAVWAAPNVIGNALRKHTGQSDYHVSIPSCKLLRFNIFLCSNLLPANHLSFIFCLWKSFMHTCVHRRLWHSVFGNGVFYCRLIIIREVCDPVTSVRNWPKETRQGHRPLQPWGPQSVSVCKGKGKGKEKKRCVSILQSICELIYILSPLF